MSAWAAFAKMIVEDERKFEGCKGVGSAAALTADYYISANG